MPHTTRVSKWGNSLGIRLPNAVVREARLEEGSAVDVSVDNGAIVVRASGPRYTLEELVDAITPRNRHAETDWGGAVGHEVW